MFELYSLFILLVLSFLTLIIKANYHFKYIKSIHPSRFQNINNYFELYLSGFFNIHRISLVLPTFKRNLQRESTELQKNLAKHTELCIKYFWIEIILIISLVLFIVITNSIY